MSICKLICLRIIPFQWNQVRSEITYGINLFWYGDAFFENISWEISGFIFLLSFHHKLYFLDIKIGFVLIQALIVFWLSPHGLLRLHFFLLHPGNSRSTFNVPGEMDSPTPIISQGNVSLLSGWLLSGWYDRGIFSNKFSSSLMTLTSNWQQKISRWGMYS